MSARVKNSTSVRVDCSKDVKCAKLPKGVESNPSENVPMFDLLKSNFLSSSSACGRLVDQLHQANDLGTFFSISLKKQRDDAISLIQKGVIFTAKTNKNLSNVASTSAQLK